MKTKQHFPLLPVTLGLAHGALVLCGVAASLVLTTPAQAATSLQVLSGSGDFSQMSSWIGVEQPKDLQMHWNTDQAAATGGTWQVRTVSCARCPSTVVASGEAPRGGVNGTWFTIPASTFLKSPYTTTQLTFSIQITAHNAGFQPVDNTSSAVTVYQTAPAGGINFGDSANYPMVEIVDQGAVVVSNNNAVTNVTVRVVNKGNKSTVPSLLSLKDDHVLMKQNTPLIAVPSLAPGVSKVVAVQMGAMMPSDNKITTWQVQNKDRCGTQLTSLLQYAGPQAQTPMNTEARAPLVEEGMADYAKPGVSSTICDGKQCINVCQLEKEIKSRLDDNVVGYSLFVGQYPHFSSGGLARTLTDGGEKPFLPSTKLSVGSVSKFVSAVGTIAVLDKYGVPLNTAIGPYLPADWTVSTYIQNLTFGQLLSQNTGIKTYGNLSMSYSQLKTFFSQTPSTDATTACPGNTTTITIDPINRNNMGYCYSNYNFGILRVLLPKVAGYPEEADAAKRPQVLANQFQTLVQQNVFERVGRTDVTCKPPTTSPGAQNYGWAHQYPGSSMGVDFGDETLVCGAASWYLSIEDISAVLMSLNARDGKILKAASPDRLNDMRLNRWGLDVASAAELEKNGAWGRNGALNSTSIAIFAPVAGNGPQVLAALFLNSDIGGGVNVGGGARGVLEQAYTASRFTLP